MSKEIFNEGRVCGESAYEIYVRQHLAEDPDTKPASPKEWLSSSLAMGTSMLLKVPSSTDESHRYVDIQLPHNCRLAAANTIVASFFDGAAHFPEADSDNPDDQYWADRVTDYGTLISNTTALSPATGIATEDTTIPTKTSINMGTTTQKQLIQYMNIVDGIIIQPGEWKSATNKPPEKDFMPNLTDTHPRLRLMIHGSTNLNPLILLTGFTINSVLCGTTDTSGSTKMNVDGSANGDFLGPAVFPWVSKVIFSVPNSFINYMVLHKYGRTLNESTGMETGDSTPTTRSITDTPIIDMKAKDPEIFYNRYVSNNNKYYEYYASDNDDPRFPVTIVDAGTGTDSAVLTVYQKKYIYPPALYGTYVNTGSGQKYLNPLDVVAPGTIKMFYNQPASTLADYETTFPGTWAFNRTSGNKIQILVNTGTSESPVWALQDVGTNVLQQKVRLCTTRENGTTHNEFRAPNTSGGMSDYATDLDSDSDTKDSRPTAIKISTDSSSYMYLAIDDTRDGFATHQITINENPSNWLPSPGTENLPIKLSHTNSCDEITWSALLAGLYSNKSIDLLGDRLKQIKSTDCKPTTPTNTSIDPGSGVDDDNSYSMRWDTSVGAAYIPFGNETGTNGPKRLYLIDTGDIETLHPTVYENPDTPSSWTDGNYRWPDLGVDNGPDPKNIPVGSLAMGWGWHSLYKVKNATVIKNLSTGEFETKKVWAQCYGSGLYPCTIESGETGAFRFRHGLVIISEHSDSTYLNGSTNAFSTYTLNPSDFTTTSSLAIYIDQFGGIRTISNGTLSQYITINMKYFKDSHGTTEVWGLSIKNEKVDGVHDKAINVVLIGHLDHRF